MIQHAPLPQGPEVLRSLRSLIVYTKLDRLPAPVAVIV
jgi:hypothetical protein